MNHSPYFKKAVIRMNNSWRGLAVFAISAGSLILLGGMPKAAMAQVAAATERSESFPPSAITLIGDSQQHTFFAQTVTMPSTGCPCYIKVEGQLVISAPLQDAADSPSFNLNASDGANSFSLLNEAPVHLTLTTPQSGIFADDITFLSATIGTSYADNQKVTLAMDYRAFGLSTGPVALQPSVKDPVVANSVYKSYILISAGPVPAPAPTVPKFGSATF